MLGLDPRMHLLGKNIAERVSASSMGAFLRAQRAARSHRFRVGLVFLAHLHDMHAHRTDRAGAVAAQDREHHTIVFQVGTHTNTISMK